jgi:hypothetical protein
MEEFCTKNGKLELQDLVDMSDSIRNDQNLVKSYLIHMSKQHFNRHVHFKLLTFGLMGAEDMTVGRDPALTNSCRTCPFLSQTQPVHLTLRFQKRH